MYGVVQKRIMFEKRYEPTKVFFWEIFTVFHKKIIWRSSPDVYAPTCGHGLRPFAPVRTAVRRGPQGQWRDHDRTRPGRKGGQRWLGISPSRCTAGA